MPWHNLEQGDPNLSDLNWLWYNFEILGPDNFGQGDQNLSDPNWFWQLFVDLILTLGHGDLIWMMTCTILATFLVLDRVVWFRVTQIDFCNLDTVIRFGWQWLAQFRSKVIWNWMTMSWHKLATFFYTISYNGTRIWVIRIVLDFGNLQPRVIWLWSNLRRLVNLDQVMRIVVVLTTHR